MKTLKGISVLVLAMSMIIAMPSTSFAKKYLKGSGVAAKEERKVPSFSVLDVSNAFEIYLTQGDKESLVIEADDNLLDKIITEVNGNVLEIYTKGNIRNSKTMKAYITFKSLDHIDLSGACDLFSENTLKFNDLKIEASGASDIEMEFTADKVYLDMSGASEIKFVGGADFLAVDVSGATDIYGQDFEVRKCIVDASGASSIKVFATDELSVDASGASSVRYKGNPDISMDASGASSIRRY